MKSNIMLLLLLMMLLMAASISQSSPDDPSLFSFDEHFFNATIDHFNFLPTTEPTFPLRYLVNDQFWQRDGPCFFYAGNEATIWQFANNTGFLLDAAREFHALVVFAEHRYYGSSQPFGSSRNALGVPYNISFLTVEQAMADFTTLAVHIRNKWDMSPQNCAFIAFGGSYGANLAMWLRLKNPNIWAGAIASSATPLKHVLRETNGFAQIETEVYANVSAQCPILVRAGWTELFKAASTATGRTYLAKILGLCHPPPNADAAQDIYGWVASALETMVQYGYPYPTSFYNPVPAYPFRVACERMVSDNTSTTVGLGALRAAVDVYFNYTGQAGFCYDFDSLVVREAAAHWRRSGHYDRLYNQRKRIQQRQTHYYQQYAASGTMNNDDNDDTDKAWNYQTCTEVYQPMPTDGVTDFLLPYTPNQDAYYNDCREQFGVEPRPSWEEIQFMGANIGAGSNIFLTNGQLDPWRAAGIQTKPRGAPESIVVRMIENGAHHLDLRASHEDDPPSVVAVRKEQRASIKEWIRQWRETCHGELDTQLVQTERK